LLKFLGTLESDILQRPTRGLLHAAGSHVPHALRDYSPCAYPLSAFAAKEATSAMFEFNTFSEVVGGQHQVHFLVLRMAQSFLLWIGDDSKELNNLSVAMPPFRGSLESVSSNLMGGSMSSLAEAISRKLAKKSACQVFVSVSLKFQDSQTELALLQRVLDEMSLHPEYFFQTKTACT